MDDKRISFPFLSFNLSSSVSFHPFVCYFILSFVPKRTDYGILVVKVHTRATDSLAEFDRW
jgi:hypothetical protein